MDPRDKYNKRKKPASMEEFERLVTSAVLRKSLRGLMGHLENWESSHFDLKQSLIFKDTPDSKRLGHDHACLLAAKSRSVPITLTLLEKAEPALVQNHISRLTLILGYHNTSEALKPLLRKMSPEPDEKAFEFVALGRHIPSVIEAADQKWGLKNFKAPDGGNLITYHVKKGSAGKLQIEDLVRRGVDANQADKNGLTPLMMTVILADQPLFEALWPLSDVSAVNDKGLCVADMIKQLLEKEVVHKRFNWSSQGAFYEVKLRPEERGIWNAILEKIEIEQIIKNGVKIAPKGASSSATEASFDGKVVKNESHILDGATVGQAFEVTEPAPAIRRGVL